MTIVDLSHRIAPGMPVYPGTDPPDILDTTSIAIEGFAEKRITMFTHTGTHMDAPAHIVPGAKTLDLFAVDQFVGAGLALDASGVGSEISASWLREEEKEIRRCEFLLLYTGWSHKWGSKGYFEGFPVLSGEAASWLTTLGLKGIGLDAISIDPVDATELTIHKILLAKDLVIIENLLGIEQLIRRNFLFSCLPLKIAAADGSPVRAVAIIDDSDFSR